MLKGFLKKIWDGGDDPSDAELYALVASELHEGLMDIGIWTKACALAGGINDKAKSSYIQMRVAQYRELRAEIVQTGRNEQLVLEDRTREHLKAQGQAEEKRRRVHSEELARQQEIRTHNALIQAKIDEIDQKRRPLLEQLYGAQSDRQRKSAASKLLPLDTKRSELVRQLVQPAA